MNQVEPDPWQRLLTELEERYANNDVELDRRFTEKVRAIVNSPIASQRKIKVDQLIAFIYNDRRQLKLYYPHSFAEQPDYEDRLKDYEEILNDTLLKVSEKMPLPVAEGGFMPTGTTATRSLAKWINKKLRLKYAFSDSQKARNQREVSDQEIGSAYEAERQRLQEHPTLAGLDRLIAEGQQDYQARASSLSFQLILQVPNLVMSDSNIRFIQYLRDDPNNILRSRHVRGVETCTYHVLVQKLYLQNPPDTVAAIAYSHNMKPQKLYAHLIRHLYDLIAYLHLEAGVLSPQEVAIVKAAIEQDTDQRLQECQLSKNAPAANAQFLSMRLLSIFRNPPLEWSTILQELRENYHTNVSLDKLQEFWESDCYRYLGKLLTRYLEYNLKA